METTLRTADDLASALGAGEIDERAFRGATERNDTERRAVERELRARIGERTSVVSDAPSTEAGIEEPVPVADPG